MQRLPTFIRRNTDEILSEWESFARTLVTDDSMDIVALRDHANEMLNVIVADLEQPQTHLQQIDKARGLSDAGLRTAATAAQEHGAGRAESGFSIEQMVSEFRALRSSVLRLWTLQEGAGTPDDLREMTRFNEAIDQAIAESIGTYTRDVKQAKDRFLAILGHDLRTPIGAIITSTKFMLDTGDPAGEHRNLIARVEHTARRMNRLVADLLEYTRTRFGDAMPVVRGEMSVDQMIADVTAEVIAWYPSSEIRTETDELHVRGRWDGERLTQALTNLVSNAVQHGDARQPIVIGGRECADEIVITVHNRGPTIPDEDLDHLFDAMKRSRGNDSRDRRHLGLGLYIVERIVAAHGGWVEVRSSDEEGTTFSMHLPKIA